MPLLVYDRSIVLSCSQRYGLLEHKLSIHAVDTQKPGVGSVKLPISIQASDFLI